MYILGVCQPDSASTAHFHFHGIDGVGMHPYDQPLHRKVLNYFIHIYYATIQSEVVPALNHVIMVCFVVVTQVQPAHPTAMALVE